MRHSPERAEMPYPSLNGKLPTRKRYIDAPYRVSFNNEPRVSKSRTLSITRDRYMDLSRFDLLLSEL